MGSINFLLDQQAKAIMLLAGENSVSAPVVEDASKISQKSPVCKLQPSNSQFFNLHTITLSNSDRLNRILRKNSCKWLVILKNY